MLLSKCVDRFLHEDTCYAKWSFIVQQLREHTSPAIVTVEQLLCTSDPVKLVGDINKNLCPDKKIKVHVS